jgi:hypothetical protein
MFTIKFIIISRASSHVIRASTQDGGGIVFVLVLFRVHGDWLLSVKASDSNALDLKEVLPKTGLLFNDPSTPLVSCTVSRCLRTFGHDSDGAGTIQVLCKPKLMPMKSVTLEKLEKMQKEVRL